MPDQVTGDRVRGRRLRWTLSEGPQAGKTYEHTFHADGTVEYRAVEDGAVDAPRGTPGASAPRTPPMRCRSRSNSSPTGPNRASRSPWG